MNKIIELLEQSFSQDPATEIIYEKDGENNWIGKNREYLRNSSLEYAKRINADQFNQGDVVIIEHNNTIDDYCKIFAVWYTGGIPCAIYKEISQLSKTTLYEKIKSEYGNNMHNWDTICSESFRENTFYNTWKTIDENNIALLGMHVLKPEILKYDHAALFNLVQSFIENNEMTTGDTYYVPSPLDEIFVMSTGILTSLITKRKTYLSQYPDNFNYMFRRPEAYLNCVHTIKEINPSVFFFCDFFYSDIKEHCLQIINQHPAITKKQLKEEIFGTNVQHTFIVIYNQTKLSTGLLDFYEKKLGLTLQYILLKPELPFSFINNKKGYVKGSIGKLASASSEYMIIDDELYIKTDAMFSGYVGGADATITETGFLKTNYRAYEDKNKYVFLEGKKRSPLLT